MVRIETSSTFPVDREVGFDYITDPTNWPQFWADLVDIPRLDRATWQKPGDTMRLRMRLAGRVTELQMTLTELSRPVLVRYEAAQPGMPDTAHERHFEPPPGGSRTAWYLLAAPDTREPGAAAPSAWNPRRVTKTAGERPDCSGALGSLELTLAAQYCTGIG